MSTTSTSSVATTSTTDAYGNTVTSAVSNDKLTSSDFIKLMLTELKLQDPTKAVDSTQMLNTQLQLSSLDASTATVKAMTALQSTFEQSALSSSASLIGNVIENGTTDSNGNANQFKVSSVSMKDGTINLTAYALNNYYDVYYFGETSNSSDVVNSSNENGTITLTNSDGNSYSYSTYNKTYADLATEISKSSGVTASMVQNSSGNYQMVVSVSKGSSTLAQNNSNLSYTKDNTTSYSTTPTTIAYSDITKVY